MRRRSFQRTLGAALILALLYLLTASAWAAPPASDDAPRKRIGVVSIVGGVLVERRLAIASFNDRRELHDIADFGLDDAWEARMKGVVESLGGFEIAPLTVDRAPLVAAYGRPSEIDGKRSLQKSAALIAKIAADNQLDLILLLGPEDANVPIVNVRIEGAGVYTNNRSGTARTIIHLASRAYLLDGATGNVVRATYLAESPRWNYAFGGFPFEDARVTLSGKRYGDYTEGDKALLQATFVAIADRFWPTTLSKVLGLTPQTRDD